MTAPHWTPAMTEAVAATAEAGGTLTRFGKASEPRPWQPPGGADAPRIHAATVDALIARGVLEVVLRRWRRSGAVPIHVRLTPAWRERARTWSVNRVDLHVLPAPSAERPIEILTESLPCAGFTRPVRAV